MSAARNLLEGFKAIAEHVGFSLTSSTLSRRRRLRRWIRAGLPAWQLEGRWYVYADELDAWMQAQKRTDRTLPHAQSPSRTLVAPRRRRA